MYNAVTPNVLNTSPEHSARPLSPHIIAITPTNAATAANPLFALHPPASFESPAITVPAASTALVVASAVADALVDIVDAPVIVMLLLIELIAVPVLVLMAVDIAELPLADAVAPPVTVKAGV